MPGFKAGSSYAAIGALTAFSGATGAVVANQVLAEMIFPWHSGHIAGAEFYAVTAGTGGGSTTLDILLNGTSVFAAAGDKPVLLAATAAAAFAMSPPTVKGLKFGDRITIIVLTVSTTGHARVSGAVALEKA
jgi:hypothetical protein